MHKNNTTRRVLCAVLFIVGCMLRSSDALDMQHERFHQGLASAAGIQSTITDRSHIEFASYDRTSKVGAYWCEFYVYGAAATIGLLTFYPIAAPFIAIITIVYFSAAESADFNRHIAHRETPQWIAQHKTKWWKVNGCVLLAIYIFAIARLIRRGREW